MRSSSGCADVVMGRPAELPSAARARTSRISRVSEMVHESAASLTAGSHLVKSGSSL